MIRKLLLVVVTLAAATAYAETPPMLVRYETPIETMASLTSPPTQVPDTIIAHGCASCAGVVLNITQATKFFVNKQEVALEELRRLAVGDALMGIYYIEETNVVTRIVLSVP